MRHEGEIMPFTKIGVTGDLAGRLRGLYTGSPFEYFKHSLMPFPDRASAMTAEASIHRSLDGYRMKGEWFRGEPDEVEILVRDTTPTWSSSENTDISMPEKKPRKLFKYELKMIANRGRIPQKVYRPLFSDLPRI
jgi:hypothetical protein